MGAGRIKCVSKLIYEFKKIEFFIFSPLSLSSLFGSIDPAKKEFDFCF